jgi:hypothetical protein
MIMNNELEHLSYSSISTYLMCGANWKYHYVDKIPTKPGSALIFGSAFHNTVENFIANNHQGDLISLWREAWATQLEADKVSDFEGASPEILCNDGIRILSNSDVLNGILSIKAATREDGKPAIETKVELNVPGVPLPIIGYIDVITSEGAGDFKTSAKSWTQDKADDELQTLFYLAALNQMGKPVLNFTHYIFVKTKVPQFQKIQHTHSPGQIFWLFQLIQSVWKGIEAGVYPLNPTGWRCSSLYCEYFNLCRGKYA